MATRTQAKTQPNRLNGNNGTGGAPRRTDRGITKGSGIQITTLDRVREQLRDQLFPEEAQSILRLALAGSQIYQQRLYERMADTWPRFQKDINELATAVARVEWKINPFVVAGQKPTASAQDKADLVTRAIHGFRPDIVWFERDFKGLVKDLVHSMILGHSLDEIKWEQRGSETMPRAAIALPGRYYGYPIQINEPDRLMLNPEGRLSNAMSDLQDFSDYPNHFVIGICQRHTAHPTVSAMFRCLVAWWLASVFGLEWLMHHAELFGLPWRIGKFKKGDIDAKNALVDFMRDLGSGGWGVFPDNAEVQMVSTTNGTGDLPQKVLQETADKICDILILGQTLTTEVGSTGGNRALGQVHQDIRDEVLEGAMDYVGAILQNQLVTAICQENYGPNVDEIPLIEGSIDQPQDEVQIAQRDKILFADMRIPISLNDLRKHNNLPVPDPSDELYVPPPPSGSSNGFSGVTAAHIDARAGRRPNLEHLLDNVLENLTHVSAQWLSPVKPIFRDLILMAQNGEVKDSDLVYAIESSAKRLPDLFGELKTDVLEAELRKAMASGLINGITDRLEN